jgi:DNA-directed RNA polymerase sigma subunit (sigma70/sigma32)
MSDEAFSRFLWPKTWERNRQVVAMHREGATLAETGRRFGLSRERVRQIITRYERLAARRMRLKALA